MGLDMQLLANRILGPIEEGKIDNVVRDVVAELGLADVEHRTTVCRVVGTLRNAHAIHRWLIGNSSIGLERDGMNRYFLSRKQIAELHEACARALDSPLLAIALLPPHGSSEETDLDHWYYLKLRSAMQITSLALELPEAEWEFEYCFSN